jgi:hypothetical protein
MENGAELKVVVHLKGNRAVLGVQGDSTDPVMDVITIVHPEDALEEAFCAAADLVEQARARWATSPRNPAYQGPPPPPAAPATTQPPRRQGRQSQPTPAQTPRMF